MENKKEFSFVFYIIFLLFLLTAGNLKAAPHIEFKKNEIDFGELKQRVRETRFFKFKNTGDDTLKITGIRTTCGCTAAVVSSESIPPGKEGRIEITFSSSTYVGEITRGVKMKKYILFMFIQVFLHMGFLLINLNLVLKTKN